MELDVHALKQLADAQQVPLRTVVEKVAAALTDAYARTPGADPAATATVDVEAGSFTITTPDGSDVTPSGFGRVAATAARQGVVQWMRDLERIRKVGPWAGREGTVVTGVARSRNRRGELTLALEGGVEAVLPDGEAIPGEELQPGQEVTVLVVAVNADDRGRVKVTVSRRQPALVSALFEQVCPELAAGTVRIVAIARDPGSRTKVAVTGGGARAALIGAGGERILRVMPQLGGEKVDVLEYSADLHTYVAAALTPATVEHADLLDPSRKVVQVRVRPDQVAFARGRADANVRLARRLTGARIEVVIA